MSAPSALHESRVDLLEDLAMLADYSLTVDVWFAERPDVVRLHRSRPSLLVGDAKATEPATGRSTRGRLLNYVEACAEWMKAGFTVDIAVVHGPDSSGSWCRCLLTVVELAGLRTASLSCWNVDDSDWISWAGVTPR